MSIFGAICTAPQPSPSEEQLSRLFRYKESIDLIDRMANLVRLGILTGNEVRTVLKLTPLPGSVSDVLKTRIA
jgi:hypothetical protein